jgi:periplasmic divalent cation tolerance protein
VVTLALGRAAARGHVLHPIDRADRRTAVLLDDQHGEGPYTAIAPWYSPRVPDDAVIVLSTLPNPEKAAEIARILVEERLCACVNLVPQIQSIYRWEGKVSEDHETLAIIKTLRSQSDALTARLVALHPYQVPEVIVLPLDPLRGHAPYLAWIADSVR